MQSKDNLKVMALVGAALALLAILNYLPVWWVALKAPQYPAEAFPDGIRIHFHVNGVFNGCEKLESKEIQEDESLNCKHEMDAINHYVGMYPIAAGAPIERAISHFVLTLLGLMLVAFAVPGKKTRIALLAAGCIVIAGWMGTAIYKEGGVMLLTDPYRTDLMETMDLDADDIAKWTGQYAIQDSYFDALGRYFGFVHQNKATAEFMAGLVHWVYGAMVVAMAVLVIGAWKTRLFYWLLIAVPLLLPVFFVIDYSGWLYWFGHNLNAMGAFTVKPFMPTVFGQGKVAQFSTHSYPHIGFGVMMAMSVLLAVAALIRRRQKDFEI